MSAASCHSGRLPDRGLLLVGHGSREEVGVGEFLATARRVEELAGELAVEPCCLEFARPDIAEGFRALVRRGVEQIVVVPVLLFAAGHAKRDIPAAVAAVAAEHPQVRVAWSAHLGCHEALLALSRLRFDEAVGVGAGDENTALVMAGRGSHDAEATAEMRQFVALRARSVPLCRTWTSFVAMAEPRLTSVLDEAVAGGAKRVVVQPHLLFGGVFVDRIAEVVAEHAARFPHVRWVTTGHLGPSELVAEALLSRAREALSPQGAARPGAGGLRR